jgi:ankyrin repeat protein
MINAIMDSKKFDLNYVDDNDDTIINIACVNPNMLWMVEKLVKNKDIDINHVNDLGYAALGEAIRHENLKALELLGKRPDLKVLDKEKEIAKKKGIDLNKYLKPSDSIFETPKENVEAVTSEVVVAETTDADKYNEIFKRVFSA